MLTVVTGASGFLGAVLVRELLAKGRQVRAVDLERGSALGGLDVEWRSADVLDPSSLDTAFDGAGVVYHLAAVISVTGDPTGRVWATNVGGVRNVARAALKANVRRLIHCSSVHAFDLESAASVDENSSRATAAHLPVYDRSKAAGEAELRSVIESGLDAVIVNPTGVIGPYDFGPSRMGRVFLAMFRRRLPAVIDGSFDWVDVRDAASSMLAAEVKGRSGENYLLPGHHLSLADLAAIAADVTGHRRRLITLPMWFARIWGPLADVVSRRSGDPLWYTRESIHALRFSPTVNGAKAAAELDHDPRPMHETVSDMYEWFKQRGLLGEENGHAYPGFPFN
ncbi:MAG: NAD-dependent epimerase/dehydratase family protein [Acidimicrobiia bacterium]